MRSDLISAAMVRHWLYDHAPALAAAWAFQPDDELYTFVERVTTAFPYFDGQFVSQNAIAKTAIDLWRLRHVAILRGGIPTPLSPPPHQVTYYTDANPEALKEAERLGYLTRRVDVKSGYQLNQIGGAATAIASGLFHFLDDSAVRQVFDNLCGTGFRTVVFNNIAANVDETLKQNWAKMGYKLYARTPRDVAALVPPDWQMRLPLTMPEFFQHHRRLGAVLTRLENIYYIYRVTRD